MTMAGSQAARWTDLPSRASWKTSRQDASTWWSSIRLTGSPGRSWIFPGSSRSSMPKRCSLSSVTQQFNPTTSMGRLTLNVLLSFAQFEREVTSERIRDKIAASKKKGMWMGGPVPIGYRSEHKQLVIEPQEADLVRHLFELYLEIG